MTSTLPNNTPDYEDAEALSGCISSYAGSLPELAGRTPPDLRSLAAFIRSDCPREAIETSQARHTANFRGMLHRCIGGDAQVPIRPEAMDWPMGLDQPGVVSYQCKQWGMAGRKKGLHPLPPLLSAWYSRPSLAPLDRRATAIIPMCGKVRDMGNPQMLAAQLGFDFAEMTQALPTIGRVNARGGQDHLPGLEPVDDTMVIPPPLMLYDVSQRARTQRRGGGHGAPYEMRLCIEFMMGTPLEHRDLTCRFTVSAREMGEWLWPNGGFWPKRDVPALADALRAVHNSVLPWEQYIDGRKVDGGLWVPVAVRNFPRAADEHVVILVELPPSGRRQGPLVHRGVLRRYGTESALRYRGYLAAAYLWDEFGTVSIGGQRGVIQATRPVVSRDDDGTLLNSDGRRVISRNGRPVRNFNHPDAVRMDDLREVNPGTERYPLLSGFDLVRMVNPSGKDCSRKARHRARKAVEKMAEDGVVYLVEGLRDREGADAVRILPPDGWGPNWAPPSGFT